MRIGEANGRVSETWFQMANKNKKSKKGKGNKSVAARSQGPTGALVPRGIRQQRMFRPPKSKINFAHPKLSENGLAFLKCAFASPDFSVDPGKGIPDQFHGRTLAIKDCVTNSIEFTAGVDTYILVAPVPGYAYFVGRSASVGAAAPIAFTGVPFPTFTTNFGDGTDTSNKFSKFRYASLAAGIYPTSNYMQFSGSIQCWRLDLNLAESLRGAVTGVGPPVTSEDFVQKRIQGMQGITPLAPRDNYSESFIKGAYTFGFDKSQDFEWQDFVSSTAFIESNNLATANRLEWDGTSRLTGLGNVNTILYKVSTPTGAVNTAMLRVWNCIELQPDTNSGLFQFSGVSPAHDPIAMELYSNMKMKFPVAVPCVDNSKFWEGVLRMIRTVSQAGSFVPGPFGMISSGVNTITSAINELVM